MDARFSRSRDAASMPTPAVAAAFDVLPEGQRTRLAAVRAMILRTASRTDGVGDVVETLKWGQPSYAPARPRIGAAIRLGVSGDGRAALFVHCQTSLIGEFRARYGAMFDFEGNRALILKDGDLPRDALRHCIALALTYHCRKRG